MSDEFQDISSRIPDIGSFLTQKIMAQKSGIEGNLPAPGTFDPYNVLIKKKQSETKEVDIKDVQKWPEEDVQQLEKYCQRVGIVGFNSGKMSPIAALSLLKTKFGDYSDVPLEERLPTGYEKMGTQSAYGPNYPYSEATKKKQLLHG